ncbi:hypothetical protein Leryth_027129 [Lithospermum erythrorhizon]|uniref:Nucleotide kinase n=1 Tax=Lithospermum erythrorhizon TaxID=34254 RepID=A0AAV3NP09_LITER|nr:hypothetical protein Leryth_027129 [Lithospermum erythrorhizon]
MSNSARSYFPKLLLILICASTLCLPQSVNGDTRNQKTLVMIKPDGVSGGYTSSIKKIIQDHGFRIVEELATELDEDSAKSFYAEHASRSFFSDLVLYMTSYTWISIFLSCIFTSGPVVVMVLEKDNAIADWRALIGPTDAKKAKISHPHSIRAMCGKDGEKNCVHGSDSTQSATREISFFFNNSSSGFVARHDEL